MGQRYSRFSPLLRLNLGLNGCGGKDGGNDGVKGKRDLPDGTVWSSLIRLCLFFLRSSSSPPSSCSRGTPPWIYSIRLSAISSRISWIHEYFKELLVSFVATAGTASLLLANLTVDLDNCRRAATVRRSPHEHQDTVWYLILKNMGVVVDRESQSGRGGVKSV